jgi:hypothetical protein
MNNSSRAVGVAFCAALLFAVPAAALTLVPAADPYYFAVEGSDNSFRILGRSLAVGGHKVYVEHIYRPAEGEGVYDYAANGARDRELDELYKNKHLLLADGAGHAYAAVNARFVRFQYFGWGSDFTAQIIEFSYPAEASGNLQLVVKTAEGSATRLDFGPAAKNYYRRGTVTADEGLNFRISPYVGYAAVEVLKAGDTFYLTGARSYSYADEEREQPVYFYEVIRDGREGWVAHGYVGEEDTFFTIGDFAAF